MTQENTFIIGDVHGCVFTLEKLLQKLPKDADVVFVGDLIDKGLYSKDVIEIVINNPKYKSVLGNHEYLFLEYAKDALYGIESDWSTLKGYGGKNTLKNYENDYDTFLKHRKWITTLPLCIDFEDYFITHGFSVTLFDKRDDLEYKHQIFANRIEDIKTDLYADQKINIFGHDANKEVQIHPCYFGIDTGCVFGNKLTAIELGTHKIIQENCDSRDSDLRYLSR